MDIQFVQGYSPQYTNGHGKHEAMVAAGHKGTNEIMEDTAKQIADLLETLATGEESYDAGYILGQALRDTRFFSEWVDGLGDATFPDMGQGDDDDEDGTWV